ncbi:hypothetical protein [Streptomyces sp. SJL17-4]|uniref:hypothetical protein n=1 Tax=Streptomyces sp. SJL17-4 TaxID=2967224 RepID=UPI0030D1570E
MKRTGTATDHTPASPDKANRPQFGHPVADAAPLSSANAEEAGDVRHPRNMTAGRRIHTHRPQHRTPISTPAEFNATNRTRAAKGLGRDFRDE